MLSIRSIAAKISSILSTSSIHIEPYDEGPCWDQKPTKGSVYVHVSLKVDINSCNDQQYNSKDSNRSSRWGCSYTMPTTFLQCCSFKYIIIIVMESNVFS